MSKKRTPPRVPSKLVYIADAKSIELDDGQTLKFPLSGKFALCSTKSGKQLWILSRKGGKTVRANEEDCQKLFEKFTGFLPDDTGTLIQLKPKALTRIGRAKNIVYRSDKFTGNNADYIHAFKFNPTVSVDNPNKPSIVAIRGGAISVKQEGITG